MMKINRNNNITKSVCTKLYVSEKEKEHHHNYSKRIVKNKNEKYNL